MALDLTSIASTLLGGDALGGISSSTGASKKDVTSVLTSALPLLLQGAGKQSKDEKTAASFAQALENHGGKSTSDLASFFKGLDLEDGSKIVSHLLGSDSKKTAEKLSKDSGLDVAQVAKILAAAAPLLMTLIGKKTAQSKKDDKDTTASLAKALLGNVDVSDILSSFLK